MSDIKFNANIGLEYIEELEEAYRAFSPTVEEETLSLIKAAKRQLEDQPNGVSLAFSQQAINHVCSTLEKDIVKQRELDKAHDESNIDPLTGLSSRHYFDREMEKSFARFKRGDIKNLSVLILDANFLKQINDKHGYGEGDRLLQTYASILPNVTRKSDVVARYGGDEFIIISTSKETEEFRGNIYEAVEKTRFTISDKSATYPCSAGIGIAKAADTESIEELIELAGQDLKLEKERIKTALGITRETGLEPIPSAH